MYARKKARATGEGLWETGTSGGRLNDLSRLLDSGFGVHLGNRGAVPQPDDALAPVLRKLCDHAEETVWESSKSELDEPLGSLSFVKSVKPTGV